jgi:hypothetical protein
MDQMKMNEHGLAESLESVLCQIVALLNITQNALDGSESSIYVRDAVQMLMLHVIWLLKQSNTEPNGNS